MKNLYKKIIIYKNVENMNTQPHTHIQTHSTLQNFVLMFRRFSFNVICHTRNTMPDRKKDKEWHLINFKNKNETK